MSTVLFVTVDAGGNVPPAVAIGRQIAAAGHRVHFLGTERQRAALTGPGFGFDAFDAMPWWHPELPAPAPRAIGNLVRLSTDEAIAGRVLQVAVAERADLVVIDCMLLSALGAVAGAGLKHAVLLHTFYGFWATTWFNGPIGRFARLRGLNARRLWSGADLELIVTDRALDPSPETESERRVWSGVTENGVAQTGGGSEPPLVLVSLSTTWFRGQTETYQRILDALGGLPVRAIVTTGNVPDSARLTAPPNVQVVDFAPHAEIMPHARAVIGHGGHSTTMAALAHDLPVVVLPMHPLIDQPLIGARVAAAGAGIVLSKKAAASKIAAAVTAVLGDDAFAASAADIGRRIRAGNGAAVAADRLLATIGQPSANLR